MAEFPDDSPRIVVPLAAMDLRDYMAIAAMCGMYAEDADSYTFESIAKAAYKTADAMLAERERKP